MPIVPLLGHHALLERLVATDRRGALPASLLLHGPTGVGKQRLALRLAQAMVCAADGERPCDRCQACRYALELAHPDVRWFFPRPRAGIADASPDEVLEDLADATAARAKDAGLYAPPSGTEGIFVATIRALVHQAALAPALARRKVFVIGDAERMVPQEGSEQAANALLKLLEEPPADTTIILTSSEPGALLPTIRSRVVAVRVPPMTDAEMRAFLAEPAVREALARAGVSGSDDELVAAALGAPGTLLAARERDASSAAARRLLEGVERGDRAERYKLALVQGVSGARGGFSDTLDALTVQLHSRTRTAAERGDETGAARYARAVLRVEEAKALASGNVNPQLVTASLLRSLEETLQ